MAWQSDSPLWAAINTLHQVPSCEEVTIPQNIEPVGLSQASLRSPIIHPRVERISGEEALKRGLSLSESTFIIFIWIAMSHLWFIPQVYPVLQQSLPTTGSRLQFNQVEHVATSSQEVLERLRWPLYSLRSNLPRLRQQVKQRLKNKVMMKQLHVWDTSSNYHVVKWISSHRDSSGTSQPSD